MWGSESEQHAFGRLLPLWYGKENVRDRRQAVAGLTALADRRYAPAFYGLGEAYFDGEGVRRNYHEAFRLFRESADQGYPSGEAAVGNFYVVATPKRNVCEYDPAEAVQWHRLAAEHGNSGAQFNLAFSYWEGRGVARDPGAACVWARLAVHCSSIRFRSAEVLRDQAAAVLDPGAKADADRRVVLLSRDLPHPWSEHLVYWKILAERAGVDI